MGVPLLRKLSTGVALAIMIALGSSTLAARGSTSFSYQPTELKPWSGDTDSFVSGINDQGQAVGYSLKRLPSYAVLQNAVLWDKDTVRNLGTLGGNSSYANAINDRGQVVGSSQTSSGDYHAFLWVNGRMRVLGTLGGKNSGAGAINNQGQVVGSSQTSSGDYRAFLWENGKMTDLGTLGGRYSGAVAINNQGQVVGSSQTSSGDNHAFLWKNGKMTDLGTLGGRESNASGINNKGQIVGNFTTQQYYVHCALWSDTIRDLSPGLGGGFEVGCGLASINNRGASVGYINLDGVDTFPFVWSNGRTIPPKALVKSVDLTDANAQGINNKGQIVVNGYDIYEGRSKAYLLTPTWVTH